MKVLVTGITGLLGSEVARVLSQKHDVIGLSKNSKMPGFETHNADIADATETYDTITKINPDIVVHTATLSNVDECEKNPDLAHRVNALGTRNVAVSCQRFDTVLVYISTDYVFSGRTAPHDGYNEYDTLDPLGTYARTKALGEWFVRHLLNKFFIIRTSWLFGSRRENFVSSVVSGLLKKETQRQANDMISSPTYVVDLSNAIARLIETRLFGIYHLSNSGFASRYDVAVYIAKIMGSPVSRVEKVALKELALASPRPHFSGLNNYLWKMNGFQSLRPWQEAIAEFLAENKGCNQRRSKT